MPCIVCKLLETCWYVVLRTVCRWMSLFPNFSGDHVTSVCPLVYHWLLCLLSGTSLVVVVLLSRLPDLRPFFKSISCHPSSRARNRYTAASAEPVVATLHSIFFRVKYLAHHWLLLLCCPYQTWDPFSGLSAVNLQVVHAIAIRRPVRSRWPLHKLVTIAKS